MKIAWSIRFSLDIIKNQAKTIAIKRKPCWETSGVFIAKNGFGDEPMFIPEDGERTMASMPLSFKKTHSHKAKAVKKMIACLQSR